MACLLPLFLCFSLLDSIYSQELRQNFKNDRRNYHANGIPLKNSQDNLHQDRAPQQQYPQWIKQDLTDNDDEDSVDQCAMVSQVQSVVIQILSTHYEYGKGIHTLHALVDSIQNDIAALKSDLKDCQRSQGKLLNRFGLSQNFTMDTSLADSRTGFQNLSTTVHTQTNQIEKLEKRHKSLRRMVTKILDDVTKLQGSGLDTTKDTTREVLTHFIEQQKEINANLVRRVRHLEERAISSTGYREGRRLRYRDDDDDDDNLSNVLLQNDAPPSKPATGTYDFSLCFF